MESTGTLQLTECLAGCCAGNLFDSKLWTCFTALAETLFHHSQGWGASLKVLGRDSRPQGLRSSKRWQLVPAPSLVSSAPGDVPSHSLSEPEAFWLHLKICHRISSLFHVIISQIIKSMPFTQAVPYHSLFSKLIEHGIWASPL